MIRICPIRNSLSVKNKLEIMSKYWIWDSDYWELCNITEYDTK